MTQYISGDGDDSISVFGTGNYFYGNDGNDHFTIEKLTYCNNMAYGGSGKDTFDFSHLETTAIDKAHFEMLQMNSIENLMGTRFNDYLSGNGDNNVITGDLGNDKILGNNGNDRLNGEQGNDILYGGNGSDFLIGQTGDKLYGGNGKDTFAFDANTPGNAPNVLDFYHGMDAINIKFNQSVAHILVSAINSNTYKVDFTNKFDESYGVGLTVHTVSPQGLSISDIHIVTAL